MLVYSTLTKKKHVSKQNMILFMVLQTNISL